MILKSRDKKLAVVRLQLQLRALKLYDGNIHGKFDDETEAAVKRFQALKKFQVDGIAGPVTNGELLKQTNDRLTLLFLHCAATGEGNPVTAKAVETFHMRPVAQGGRGWDRCGYSDIIELPGNLVNMRKWDHDDFVSEWEETWGVLGTTLLNRGARHLCYIGGVEKTDTNKLKDTRTPGQLASMETYIKFTLLQHPDIVIAGHNQVQNKGCPSFDVPTYLKSIGIPERNIALWGHLYE